MCLALWHIFLCWRAAQKFLKLGYTLQYPLQSLSSSLLMFLWVRGTNYTNHSRAIIIIAPFLVVPFPIARASCSTNAPLRLPASFLPSSGNNSHESQHDTALGWKFTAFPSCSCAWNLPGLAMAPSRVRPTLWTEQREKRGNYEYHNPRKVGGLCGGWLTGCGKFG